MRLGRAVLVVVFGALVGSAFFVIPVRAQSGNCDYPRVWDFTAGDYAGWTIQHGTQTANGAGPVYINSSTKLLQMTLMCDNPVGNPRKFLYGFWSSHGWAGNRPYSIALLDENGDVILGQLGQGSGAAGQGWWEYSGNMSAVYGIQIYFQWGTSETYWVNYFEINHTTPVPTSTPMITPTPVVVPGVGAGWSYPVAQRDRPLSRPDLYRVLPVFAEIDLENLTETVPSALLGLSLGQGANVHAVLSGQITEIAPLSGMCIHQGGIPNIQPGSCQMNDPGGGLTEVLHLFYQQAQLVTQDVGEGRFIRYVVASPRVRVGDVVEQDCILGQTLPMSKGYPILEESQAGWTLLEGVEGEAPFDLLTPLSREPDDLTCRAEPSPQCSYVRNPDFQSADFWELGSYAGQTPSIALGGGLVPTGYAVQRDIFLDPDTEYAILVRHIPEPAASSYSFSVELGTESHMVQWIPADGVVPQDTLIPAQVYTPLTAGGLFNLSISGLANAAATTIDFICIFEPAAALPQPTGGCLLFNHEFDQNSASWNSAGVVVWGGGLARVLDTGSIAQPLRLSPKASGPQSYTLAVRARRAGVYAAGESIDLGWTWSSFSGVLTGFTTTQNANFQEKTATFTVSGAATADLTLTVDAQNSTPKSLHLDRVCITTNDGAVPPGYLDPPLIEANCKICVYEPSGEVAQDLSELVSWLGCMLLSLWECSVKSVLVGLWQTLTTILMMLGYFRMWLSLSFANFAEWANANTVVLAQFLGGELTNVGTRLQNSLTSMVSVTQIQTGSAGLWEVLLALINQLANTIGNVIYGVISPLIDLVREVLGGILQLVVGLIDLMFALLGVVLALVAGFVVNAISLVLGIFQAILNGVNMAPAEIPPWLAACSDPLSGVFTPSSQIGYLCLGVYVMEQRMQQGAAQYFIPVFMGLASLALLLWGAQALLNAVASLGGGGGTE